MDRVSIIPIKNIYYMLYYSWGRLKENELIDVSSIASNDMVNLFARILIKGLNHLIKTGLSRKYSLKEEELKTIRGKLLISDSLKNMSFNNGKAICSYDELSYNCLENQILKSTILLLIKSNLLNSNYKVELKKLLHYFREINLIRLKNKLFYRVKLNKNNRYYLLLLDVCQIIFNNILIDENTGKYKFKDFIKDEREMAYIFEEFIRNFYKQEQNKYKVKRDNISWNFKYSNIKDKKYIPIMQTDITLRGKQDLIIIDTKYYKNALTKQYRTEKINSSNLYQITAYMENIKSDKEVHGVLVYPTINEELNLNYDYNGKRISIKTLNLNKEWQYIHARLISIIGL